jgi:hypothetical protein
MISEVSIEKPAGAVRVDAEPVMSDTVQVPAPRGSEVIRDRTNAPAPVISDATSQPVEMVPAPDTSPAIAPAVEKEQIKLRYSAAISSKRGTANFGDILDKEFPNSSKEARKWLKEHVDRYLEGHRSIVTEMSQQKNAGARNLRSKSKSGDAPKLDYTILLTNVEFVEKWLEPLMDKSKYLKQNGRLEEVEYILSMIAEDMYKYNKLSE